MANIITDMIGRAFMSPYTNISRKCLRISVEGNIGSGKTSFISYFKKFPFVETYEEPLNKWRDLKGHNLLRLMYDDMEKWNATFQSYVQLTRVEIQTSNPKKGIKVQMFERSVQNNRYCFLENALERGTILPAEHAVLCSWYEWIQENVDISLDLLLYLRTTPETALERVLARNRKDEKNVSLDYLKSVHLSHEKWLNDPNQKIPVMIIDANENFEKIIQTCERNMPKILTK